MIAYLSSTHYKTGSWQVPWKKCLGAGAKQKSTFVNVQEETIAEHGLPLTLRKLGKKFSRGLFEIFSFFFLENRLCHVMQIVSLGGWSESLLGAQIWRYVFWRCGSLICVINVDHIEPSRYLGRGIIIARRMLSTWGGGGTGRFLVLSCLRRGRVGGWGELMDARMVLRGSMMIAPGYGAYMHFRYHCFTHFNVVNNNDNNNDNCNNNNNNCTKNNDNNDNDNDNNINNFNGTSN